MSKQFFNCLISLFYNFFYIFNIYKYFVKSSCAFYSFNYILLFILNKIISLNPTISRIYRIWNLYKKIVYLYEMLNGLIFNLIKDWNKPSTCYLHILKFSDSFIKPFEDITKENDKLTYNVLNYIIITGFLYNLNYLQDISLLIWLFTLFTISFIISSIILSSQYLQNKYPKTSNIILQIINFLMNTLIAIIELEIFSQIIYILSGNGPTNNPNNSNGQGPNGSQPSGGPGPNNPNISSTVDRPMKRRNEEDDRDWKFGSKKQRTTVYRRRHKQINSHRLDTFTQAEDLYRNNQISQEEYNTFLEERARSAKFMLEIWAKEDEFNANDLRTSQELAKIKKGNFGSVDYESKYAKYTEEKKNGLWK